MEKPGEKNELIARLSRVLLHEVRMGFLDRAVFGGLEKFVASWAGEATGLRSEKLSEFSEEAARQLRSYSQKDAAQREEAVRSLLASVSGLGADVGAASRGGRSVPLQEGRSSPTSMKRPPDDVARGLVPRPRPGGGQAFAPEASAPPHGGKYRTPALQDAQQGKSSRTGARRAPAPQGKKIVPRTSTSAQPKLQGLDSSVRTLPGVGNSYAAKLERLGCFTIRDLLYLIPRRHVDYSLMSQIKDLRVGRIESVLGTIWEIGASPTRSGIKLTNATVADETGTISAVWFNQPHLAKTLTAGRQVVLSGRVEENMGRPYFKSPDWELAETRDLVHTGRMIPVYPLTEGLPERWMRALIKRVLDRWIGEVPEHLPAGVRQKWNLDEAQSAIYQIHFPDDATQLHKAQRRLAFDELLLIQMGMLLKKRDWQQSQPGNPLKVDREVVSAYLSVLPFDLTAAQKRVIEEILSDLQSTTPMIRLLQGEVGSGKTVVACAAMVVARDNLFQSALMAPTEILAEQHYRTVSKLVQALGGARHAVPLQSGAGHAVPLQLGAGGIKVGLLTGSLKKAEREAIREAVARGEIDVVIGTHAVIQEGITFDRLGLVIVDEQHRFGVEQRSALGQKGYNPHVLAMTATPIPRTLALTFYGDLDLSVINELPPGRQQVKTYLIGARDRPRAYDFVRQQIAAGRQAFVVCPLVEESEKIEAKAATAEYERLKGQVFSDLKLGLLHGKMRPREKEAVMADFRDGRLDILVSTAVVEVGIDVPNATVMLIEGADRFGLAQIHQFRGRVGRGAEKSYCLLVAESPSAEAEERLQVMTRIHDGFLLAEEDLKLRGPGEFFGTRQSGLPDLKVARLSDVAILEEARAAAAEILDGDRHLALPEHRLLAQKVAEFWRADGHMS